MVDFTVDSVIGIILILVLIAILIWNTIYIDQVRKEIDAGRSHLSKGGADVIFYVDIILIILLFFLLLGIIIRGFVTKEQIQSAQQYLTQPVQFRRGQSVSGPEEMYPGEFGGEPGYKTTIEKWHTHPEQERVTHEILPHGEGPPPPPPTEPYPGEPSFITQARKYIPRSVQQQFALRPVPRPVPRPPPQGFHE